jgi:hypothetical protein
VKGENGKVKTENRRNLTRNIKTTCGGSGENVCAVIAVIAVFKTAETACQFKEYIH